MLKKARLGSKRITEDNDNFKIDGMVEPTFYNFGAEDVQIVNTIVKPGESFLAGVHNMEMEGEVPIRFIGTNKKGRNLQVYWGAPISNC